MKQEINRRSPEKQRIVPNFTLRRFGAVFITSAVLLAGVEGFRLTTDEPKFSVEKTEWVAGSEQGLNAAAAHINGISGIDIRAATYHIEHMKHNIKPLSDGLQDGETLEIPVSVTP
jgi:hypothetical protein